MKLCTVVLALNDHLACVEGWELLVAGKMLRSILLLLYHYLRIFFHFDSQAFL